MHGQSNIKFVFFYALPGNVIAIDAKLHLNSQTVRVTVITNEISCNSITGADELSL